MEVDELKAGSNILDETSPPTLPQIDVVLNGGGVNRFGMIGDGTSGSSILTLPMVPSVQNPPLPSEGSPFDHRTLPPSRMSATPGPLTPHGTAASPAGPSVLQQQHVSPDARPLNVTDALSYLDAVKVQFQDKPEVYNQFLDIMKDFKSQVIDTPGVIQRVSRLFHGNPYLIQGFNTFLPAGYRIDISADPSDNTITVTTPMGTTTQTTNATITNPRRDIAPLPPLYPAVVPIVPNLVGLSMSRPLSPIHFTSQAVFDPMFSPGLQGPQTAAAASFLGNLNGRNPVAESNKPAGAEFNHAIQYLNKIKARYSDDPNMYKQFLDILQAYQKEQRVLEESSVYIQVQTLFKDAPDLLAEFKDFLPEVAGIGKMAHQISVGPVSAVPSGSWVPPSESSPALAPAKKPTQALKRRKKVAEKDPTPVPPAKASSSRTKRAKHHHNQDTGSPPYSPYTSPRMLQSHVHTSGAQPPPVHVSHGSQAPSASHDHALLNNPVDKLLFFDRAKRSLETHEYDEFLKLLALFTKEVIDAKTLVERSKVLFRENDLMVEFKELVGVDDHQDNVEHGPPGSVRTGPPEALSALPADDGQGPSYRKLPNSEIRLACSGRDELCRSVLNDEWVSHPTWASEEAGFVAHKKNSFEEALHKSEEERHEYHVEIEAMTRTIALLEPLNARIEEMTNEERMLFKLKPDLGGSSKSIYNHILKKVYGKESYLEVLQALQECPGVAVPVVLARLKQKNEEWRRAQREWSRTWREVDSKNFYKSLDHQGISFKQNDKKNITAKHFVSDIESIKNQQLGVWEQEDFKGFSQGSVGHQLEYAFRDTSVLLDSLKMVYSFLDRSQAQYSSQERRSVEKFLRTFIPLLCMYPSAEFNAACGPLEGGHDDALNELNGHPDGRKSTGSVHSVQSNNGIPASDLRKKLLKTAQERETKRDAGSSSTVGSRAASPAMDNRSPKFPRGDNDTPDFWVKESGTYTDIGGSVPDGDRPFFANTTFYTLLRLLQLLYARLSMCKEIGFQLAALNHAPLLANPVAVDLGLDDPNGPAVVLKQTMEVLGDRGQAEGANVVYMYLLNACEKLFDNELDQATFEEHMRWFFGNKAYHLFTLDKLITALVKQVQTILSDNKCQELWSLLQSAQISDNITNQDIVRYRREAEQYVQDDHLYRIQWVRESKCIRVWLVSPEDPSVETDRSRIRRWREYVDTYVMTYPTEWLPSVKKGGSTSFLRRCLRMGEESTASTVTDNKMRIRVGLPTYKLMYEGGCEDVTLRVRSREEEDMLMERARAREEERKRSRWILTQAIAT